MIILTGPIHSGKTSLLKRAAAALMERGIPVHGFLSESRWDKGQVMIRYYGLYANAHRGKINKAGVSPSYPPIIEDETPFVQDYRSPQTDLHG